MPTDEIRLVALEAAIEGYEDAVAMLPSKYGNAAREELRLVLEVLHAAEVLRNRFKRIAVGTGVCPSEMADYLCPGLDKALAALRSFR